MTAALVLGVTLLASIAVPFLYYSVTINAYGQKNQPEGFGFPHISDFWRVLAVALLTQFAKMIIMKLTQPFFGTIAKDKTDKEKQAKYARKASDNLHLVIEYTVFTVWGY